MSSNCTICLNTLGLHYISLGCSHNFHSHCIEQWRERNNRCPICRSDIINNTLQNYCRDWARISNENRLSYLIENKIFKNPIQFRKNNIIKKVTDEEHYMIKQLFDFEIDNIIININDIVNDKFYLICSWNSNHFIIGKLTNIHTNIYKSRLDLVHIRYIYRDNGYHNKSPKKRLNIDLNKDIIYKLRFN